MNSFRTLSLWSTTFLEVSNLNQNVDARAAIWNYWCRNSTIQKDDPKSRNEKVIRKSCQGNQRLICEEPRLGLNQLIDRTDRWRIPHQDEDHLGTIPIWLLVFYVCVPGCSRNGSGVSPYVWVQKNSCSLDRAPKMRDSVQLNSWDSFLATLSSISSKTCVMYSSLILGRDVFRDWPFLGCSSCFSWNGHHFSLVSQCCHRLKEKN